MGHVMKSLLVAALLFGGSMAKADAAWFGLSRVLKTQMQTEPFQVAALVPLLYMHYYRHDAAQCQTNNVANKIEHNIFFDA
ncbi:MAG: hypothetical protein ACLPID_02680 [Beijerinckiaceae bacterium]